MEQKHKQINDLITKIALGNPYITKDQISRARSMYNGDTRPIEVIEEELMNYSAEISATNNRKDMPTQKNNDEGKQAMPAPHSIVESNPQLMETTDTIIPIVEEKGEELSTPDNIIEPLESSTGEYNPKAENHPHQVDEIEAMITEYQAVSAPVSQTNDYSEPVKENPKQYVKKQENVNDTGSDHNEGGYGNVPAILTIATILSIMTIVMAFFTIIAS